MTYYTEATISVLQRLIRLKWPKWATSLSMTCNEKYQAIWAAGQLNSRHQAMAPVSCADLQRKHGIRLIKHNQCVAIRFEPELGPADPPSRLEAARKAMTLLSVMPNLPASELNLN